MGWTGGDEVSVGLVDDQCDAILFSESGKGGDEGRGVDCACLGRVRARSVSTGQDGMGWIGWYG